jgi:flagellar FliJ protein
MKAFRFRLEVVLTLRQEAEQVARRLCARVFAALEQANGRLRSAEAAIAADDQRRRARLAGPLRAVDLEQSRRYGALLEEHRALAVREVACAQEQLEAARQKLLLATREREILERLRERQRRAYDYQAARAEQKLLDELSQLGPAPIGPELLTPALAL